MSAKQAVTVEQLQRRHFRLAVRNARNRLIEQRKATPSLHDKRVLTIQIRALFQTLKKLRPNTAGKS